MVEREIAFWLHFWAGPTPLQLHGEGRFVQSPPRFCGEGSGEALGQMVRFLTLFVQLAARFLGRL